MSERDFYVLRCTSVTELNTKIQEYRDRGWEPIGGTELFDGQYVQAIRITFDIDDTEEITQRL